VLDEDPQTKSAFPLIKGRFHHISAGRRSIARRQTQAALLEAIAGAARHSGRLHTVAAAVLVLATQSDRTEGTYHCPSAVGPASCHVKLDTRSAKADSRDRAGADARRDGTAQRVLSRRNRFAPGAGAQRPGFDYVATYATDLVRRRVPKTPQARSSWTIRDVGRGHCAAHIWCWAPRRARLLDGRIMCRARVRAVAQIVLRIGLYQLQCRRGGVTPEN